MPSLPKLLESPRVRRALGLLLTAQGLVGFLAPRRLIELSANLYLREAFENPGDLEPTDAYAGLVRDVSLGTVVAGVLVLRRAAQDEATATAEGLLAEAEAEADADSEPEPEPEPVDVDVEEAEDHESESGDED